MIVNQLSCWSNLSCLVKVCQQTREEAKVIIKRKWYIYKETIAKVSWEGLVDNVMIKHLQD